MAAARKLNAEVNQTLKKVTDGLEDFDVLWERVESSNTQSQREKFTEELKKELNKLQRLRNSIKSWQSESEVKDKSKLEAARKAIEANMEKFSLFEKDSKRKAFSTQALNLEDEVEPEELERQEHRNWILDTLTNLRNQRDDFEAEVEALKGASRAARKEQLGLFKTRHTWHIDKLELLLRHLDNGKVDLSELQFLRESIEYYIEDAQNLNADLYFDETLYDCFNLDEPVIVAEPPKEEEEKRPRKKREDKKKREEKEEKKSATPAIQHTLPLAPRAPKKEKKDDEIGKVQEEQLVQDSPEFICKICLCVVGWSSKLTKCSHLFCEDCLAEWFNAQPKVVSWAAVAKVAGSERTVPCPVCKSPLQEKGDLYPVDAATARSECKLLWRMLQGLKVKCEHHRDLGGQCDWVGEYAAYREHAQGILCKGKPSASMSASSSCSEKCKDVAKDLKAAAKNVATDVAKDLKNQQQQLRSQQASDRAAREAREAAQGEQRAPERPAERPQAVAEATPPPSRGTTTVPKEQENRDPQRLVVAAAASFEPQNDANQLHVTKGELVEVLEAHDSGWTYGRSVLKNTRGWFPQYLVPAAPKEKEPAEPPAKPPVMPQRIRVRYPFAGSADASQLSLSPGDLVEVLERHASGWAYGKEGQAEGWFPAWMCDPRFHA